MTYDITQADVDAAVDWYAPRQSEWQSLLAESFAAHRQAAIAACADHFRLEGVKMGLKAATKAADESIDALSDDCCLDHVGDAVAAIRNLDAEAIAGDAPNA